MASEVPNLNDLDKLCSKVPGAVDREVREQLVNAGTVEVINLSTVEELEPVELGGSIDYCLAVAHDRFSKRSGGWLYRTVEVREI